MSLEKISGGRTSPIKVIVFCTVEKHTYIPAYEIFDLDDNSPNDLSELETLISNGGKFKVVIEKLSDYEGCYGPIEDIL